MRLGRSTCVVCRYYSRFGYFKKDVLGQQVRQCSVVYFLDSQPSPATASNRSLESAPTKGSSGSAKRPGLRKKPGVKRESKAIHKSDKSGSRRKVIFSSQNIWTKILDSIAAVSTTGELAGTTSTHDVLGVALDDNGALTILNRSSLDNENALKQ